MMKSSRVAGGQQGLAEGLDAGRVAQVQAEDLEPVPPLAEIGLLGVTCRRVAREARGDDQRGAGAQQLQAGLVADLDAAAGEQRDAAAEVGGLGALEEIEVAAGRAHLVVEVVDARVLFLAHVAVLRLERFAHGPVGDLVHGLVGRREVVRRGEHRLAAQLADAGGIEQGVVMGVLLAHLGALLLAPPLAVVDRVGVVEAMHGGLEALLLDLGQRLEHGAVSRNGLEQVGGGAQALDQVIATSGRRQGRRFVHVQQAIGRGRIVPQKAGA